MRTQTIIKELDKVIKLWEGDKKQKQKAVKKLVQLRNRLALKLQEEQKKQLDKNPTAFNLFRWYYGIWDGKIPEGNAGRAVNAFKQLIEEFKLDPEEIKELYLWWKELEEKDVPNDLKRLYSIVLTDKETRSITDFKGKLRYIKGLKNSLQQTTGWVSDEYKHDESQYGVSIVDIEEIQLDEEEEDVPEF